MFNVTNQDLRPNDTTLGIIEKVLKRKVFKSCTFGISKPLDLKAVIRKSFALTHNICFANVPLIIQKALWKRASNNRFESAEPLSTSIGYARKSAGWMPWH